MNTYEKDLEMIKDALFGFAYEDVDLDNVSLSMVLNSVESDLSKLNALTVTRDLVKIGDNMLGELTEDLEKEKDLLNSLQKEKENLLRTFVGNKYDDYVEDLTFDLDYSISESTKKIDELKESEDFINSVLNEDKLYPLIRDIILEKMELENPIYEGEFEVGSFDDYYYEDDYYDYD